MRVCIFGKYPPTQGGVSTRTYWTAHGLAKLGHIVHVITNAKETAPPYRMFMQDDDWKRCEVEYGGGGSVTVHWTEGYARLQSHIPRGTPFVTKLASLGLALFKREPIDVIYSYYMEPYCVAAQIVADAVGAPFVVRTAGSDAGRLWSLPQFAPLYEHIFRSADVVICSGAVAPKMVGVGVETKRIKPESEPVSFFNLFTPDGPSLDVDLLRRQILGGADGEFKSLLFGEFNPSLVYLGVYGKLGRAKGTNALVNALKLMKSRSLPVGLLMLAHEPPLVQSTFRDFVCENDLQDRVCQLPFLPHWRVPEFIRRCVAVCCLEQDFPIRFHAPVVAREVLTCGGCLVASSELVSKLPSADKLVDKYNCLVVKDVNQVDDLAATLTWALENPDHVIQMRRRARDYAAEIEVRSNFPRKLESILDEVARAGRRPVHGYERPRPQPTAGTNGEVRSP